MEDKQLVVVLTRNHSTGLSVIRSLGEAGYTVDVIAGTIKENGAALVSASKYVRNFKEIVSVKVGTAEDMELVDALLEYRVEEPKPVLFPTDDYTAAVMDNNREALEEIFIMPGMADGVPGNLVKHMHKGVQGEMAVKAGVKAPEQWVISLRDEEIAVPDDIVFPCFVKPAQSFLGYKLEMRRCETREFLESHLKEMKESFPDREVLVQRFMNIENEIDIEGVSLDQEVILPGVIWKSVVAKHERGVPLAGEVMPFEKFEGLKEQVENLIKSYGYYGLFDLGINLIGDEYYFNEINMRSGGTNFAYFMSGVNLPDLFVKAMTGKEIVDEEKAIPQFGKTYYYEKQGWEDYLNGYLTREEIDRLYEEADIRFISNEKDPGPEEPFLEGMLRREELRRRKAECIEKTVEKSGWTEEAAEEHIRSARERLGVSYADYDSLDMWKLTEEEQKAAYDELLERRAERDQKRAEYAGKVAEKSGWTQEEAYERMRETRKRIGISFADYDRLDLWKFSEEEQKAEYDAYIDRKEKLRQKKLECIEKTVEKSGWTSEMAEEHIRDARDRLGVSYADYDKLDLWKLDNEAQEKAYSDLVAKRKRRKEQKENCIGLAMVSMKWSREQAEKHLADARALTGITYKDYARYEFFRVPEKKQEKEYKKILDKKSRK